jgi:catechol 2,3-dioxygenase-like lactoylglutathione lyase family enzyme
MFDHITLRVPDLAVATRAFTPVLDELEIEQTTATPSFSVWGNFALTQTDDEHPIARRIHVAFIAPTTAHVDRFGATGPRPHTPRTTTRHLSKTTPATASKRCTATDSAPRATSITS